VYIDNYNVSRAEKIIPAADLSEQISTAGMEASGTGNMKLAINGALTIGTHDGANIEMSEAVTAEWWPFAFGASAEELRSADCDIKMILQNEKILAAVESLRDHTFALDEEEHQSFLELYNQLTQSDRFFVLKDLESYYQTQLRVEELYQDRIRWAEHVLHNIASMGRFSSDQSIRNYAEKIWGIAPCPMDQQMLFRIEEEFAL